jgi:putative Holliday junction resolvase
MLILGVDWGRVRVGVAKSDELGLLAHPLTSLKGGSLAQVAEEMRRLAQEHRATAVVVGLPRNMDDTEGESAAEARRLAERLQASTGLPVRLWDERLTSWEAKQFLARGRRLSPAKRRQLKDQVAACLILQSYLNAQKARR